MTTFVLLALLLSLLAGAFVVLPLLRARAPGTRVPLAAALTLLALLVAGFGLYASLGDRYWNAPPADTHADQTIATLARHVEQHPDDRTAWLQLGEAYNVIGNYSLALRCYQSANRLGGGRDPAALTGMAESMLAQDDSGQNGKAVELLDRALQLDPHYPKALFFGAVVAYRDGQLELARQRFESLLAMSPPESVRAALQHQIEEIDAQIKGPPASGRIDAATAIHLHVTVSPALASQVPADAALFVFVRSPDGGPPLAAKRSSGKLPQEIDLSAADSMVADRAVQPGQSVAVVARISASGSAQPRSGDLYGEIHYVAGKSGAQALEIDKRTP